MTTYSNILSRLVTEFTCRCHDDGPHTLSSRILYTEHNNTSCCCNILYRCGGPKGMEPAAGAFTDTRDSWPLQVGIKDLSSLYPVTVTNC